MVGEVERELVVMTLPVWPGGGGPLGLWPGAAAPQPDGMCGVLVHVVEEPGRIRGREGQYERGGREPEEEFGPLRARR